MRLASACNPPPLTTFRYPIWSRCCRADAERAPLWQYTMIGDDFSGATRSMLSATALRGSRMASQIWPAAYSAGERTSSSTASSGSSSESAAVPNPRSFAKVPSVPPFREYQAATALLRRFAGQQVINGLQCIRSQPACERSQPQPVDSDANTSLQQG